MHALTFIMFSKYQTHILVFRDPFKLHVLSIDNCLISQDIWNAFSQVSDYMIMVEWFCFKELDYSITFR